MKSLLLVLAGICMVAMDNLHAAAHAPKTLKVKSAIKGYEIPIQFTDQTTIAQIKEAIQTDEQIPVEWQKLRKSDGWVFGFFPTKLITILESSQTCAAYDLQDNESVTLYLIMPKSKEQIEAELKVRRDAISDALLQNYLPINPLSIVFSYDTLDTHRD